MKRVILSAAMTWLLFLSVSVCSAQTKKVTLKSGPPLIGTVTLKDDRYEVMTRAGKVTVPVDQVISITDYVTFEQEYSRRVLALQPNDAEGHYALAQWCMGEKQLDHARRELLTVLKIKPGHENARLLLALVDEELAKARKPRKPGPGAPKTIPGTKIPVTEMVSKEDVLRVRLAELRSFDKVGIAFRDRADVRFADKMTGKGEFADPNYRWVFLRKKPVAKAVEMLITAPDDVELHRDILVRTNPRFMTTFKSRVWPMIAQNCAAATCHGGVKGAGRLKLYNVRTTADELYFTNFLILDAFANTDGRMIDRSHPARSLLLQFGLPTDEARKTHPVKIRSMYRGVDDPPYRFVETWIKELLNPHPKYDIRFRIPQPAQPARPVRPTKPTPPADGAQ